MAESNRSRPEVVVITGASAGAGRAAACAFAQQGAHVGLLARGHAGLEGARHDDEHHTGRRQSRPFRGVRGELLGITASDGPGPVTRRVKGKQRHFFGYHARGVPEGPDDGSISPWAVVASLPFAPEIVLPVLQHFSEMNLDTDNPYGFKATYNATYPEKTGGMPFWVSPFHYALNQGPIVLMIENFRSGLPWRLMRCPFVVEGLRRAGFTAGWLSG